MAALMRERDEALDRAATAERVAIECLRVLTPEQYAELRSNAGFLDDLGGLARDADV
jgi:hypothetical protein